MPKVRGDFLYLISFLSPVIIVFSLFYYYPLALDFYYSFTDWNLLTTPKFIGFENYLRLFSDEIFIKSLVLTSVYVIVVLLGSIFIGLVLSFVIDRPTKLATLTRIVIFIPYVIPDVAAAAIWSIVFAPGPSGYVNYLLSKIGLGTYSWFLDPNLAFPMIIAYSIWKYFGFCTLVLYSGIKAIPKEYIEAAKVDGASEFNIFTRITLPLLRPIIVFVTSTNLMSCWFVFSSVYTLTKGGPGTATMVMGMYIYEQAFKRMKAGLATAAAIINTIVVLLIVIFIHLRGYRGGLYGR